MNILMKRLPNEIQIIIGGFIGSSQPKKLCDDIKSYFETSNRAITLYMNNWEHNPDDAYDWLTNDTIRFLNRDIPTMYGYQEYYKNIIRRHYSVKCKDEEDVEDILGQLDEYGGELGNNLFKITIGLLNPHERKELLNFFETFQLTIQE